MDEAEDLPVSGSGRWLASRCAHHRQGGLVRLSERGTGCRDREAHLCAHPAERFGILHHLSELFILKTIGLGRAGFAAVYGRRVVPLSPVPAPPITRDLFSR